MISLADSSDRASECEREVIHIWSLIHSLYPSILGHCDFWRLFAILSPQKATAEVPLQSLMQAPLRRFLCCNLVMLGPCEKQNAGIGPGWVPYLSWTFWKNICKTQDSTCKSTLVTGIFFSDSHTVYIIGNHIEDGKSVYHPGCASVNWLLQTEKHSNT